MQELEEYLRELLRQRAEYEQSAQDQAMEHLREDEQRERRPPRLFVDSSLLYIRSFSGDNGNRPVAGNPIFWLSPDVLVTPLSSPAAATETLVTGQTYHLRARVRNRGDMGAPSAKVEFWLTDPTLGFDTRYAEHLTLGRVPSAWVGANATAEANATWTVAPAHSGHKCLFARVFSFSPLDKPVHPHWLDPTIDRHIAQHNLNIVKQGQPFMFQFIHAPNARAEVEIQPAPLDELLRMAHLIPFDFAPFQDLPRNAWTELTRIDVTDSDAGGLDADRISNGFRLVASDPLTPDVGTLRELRRAVKDALAQAAAGRTRASEYRDLFAKFRDMTGEARRTLFRMQAPELGLDEGQAFALHIRAFDASGDHQRHREVLGGLTLVVKG